MPNFVDVPYEQTGKSLDVDSLGMREMQRRAFAERTAQYLLLKSPPASGKSRALMFLGLDKLYNQGIKKVIVAVPEKSIGGSFDRTKLTNHGFFADWDYDENYNLCTPGGDDKKVRAFRTFIEDKSQTILICTHATLRFAFNQLDVSVFNDTLLAIDEFHHVSAAIESKLGEVLNKVMNNTNAHVVAMTGSYFRGDNIPVLLPEDEIKFTPVTYNYYEQLNGYKYLKSLGIGYHFYQGKYLSAIEEVLDTDQKTIIHIPSPNQVDTILDFIGTVEKQDPDTGVIYVKRNDGKIIKIADLVNDIQEDRDKIIDYLRKIKHVDDIDIIIALGMAKEGFDWPYCEHALTIGYRGSLTEIIQIIGRATRDSDNKSHSQFTNLIAQPDVADGEIKLSVNNMLKAITASLLMEQVLAPHINFRTKTNQGTADPGTIQIGGFKEPSTKKVKQILESDLNDLKAAILQDDQMIKAIPGNVDPEVISQVLIPKIIQTRYPEISKEEVEEIRQHIMADSVIKNGEIKEVGGKKWVRMANTFINIDELHIDLIDKVNPFQKAFEVLSKSVTTQLLKVVSETIDAQNKIAMTDEEAVILYKKIGDFIKNNEREPKLNSKDSQERRMAEAIIFLRNKKRQQK